MDKSQQNDNWLEEIQNNLDDIKDEHRKTRKTLQKRKRRKGFSNLNFALIILVVVLGSLTYFTWNKKVKAMQESTLPAAETQQSIYANAKPNELFESQQMMKGNTVQKDDAVQKNHERIQLLGILHNNNIAALSNRRPEDVVYLGSNWKINRLPPAVTLQSSDVEFLRKHMN